MRTREAYCTFCGNLLTYYSEADCRHLTVCALSVARTVDGSSPLHEDCIALIAYHESPERRAWCVAMQQRARA